MMKIDSDQVYISRVRLGGYKSIRYMEIDLLPGLNIIIGPNGSGKTNFVELLWRGFKRRTDNFDNEEIVFEANINTDNKEKFTFKIQPVYHNGSGVSYERFLTKNGQQKISEHGDIEFSFFFSNLNTIQQSVTKISHYVPDLEGFTSEVHFRVERNEGEVEELKRKGSGVVGFKLKGVLTKHVATTELIHSVHTGFFELLDNDPEKVKKDEEYILDNIQLDKKILNYLNAYTPVKDMRIKRGYRVQKKNGEFSFEDISYEFLVNDKWLRWRQLSEGTKRLLYIVAEITAASGYKGPILIEEPELGVHPDEIFKLMDFLADQSKHKQIIVTTHSPMVLDVLERTGLNRIIITNYDSECGTKMRHLTARQIEKAQSYMDEEGLWLRDYWLHSDLEGEIV